MTRILVIARNTFSEAIRDRVFFGISAFAVLYIILTIFLGKLSLGNMLMIRSFGLAGVYLASIMCTIFLGSSLLHKEIDRRTLYFVLSKPATRAEVVIGKFFGLFFAVALATLLMAAVYLGVITYQGGGFDVLGLAAILLQLVEVAVFVALLLALSAIVAPLTATICATIVLVTGHLVDTALATALQGGGGTVTVLRIFHYAFPNLEKFDIRNLVVHGIIPDALGFFAAILYGAVYSALLITIAVILFERREL